MTPIPLNLATEDELSEAILLRLLGEIGKFAIGLPYGRQGFGYLKKTISGWNAAAASVPFLVLTDLDTAICPAGLLQQWLPDGKHPNLIFRVAVREVESWLLADPNNLASFLKVRRASIPANPDELRDPKAELVALARGSGSSTIRSGIVPRIGSTAKQGPDYNGLLCSFVRTSWDPRTARAHSPSLARTYERLSGFKPTWSS